MADLKISQFADGGAVQSTDEIATNRAGINTKVFVGSAAALDAGSGVGDVITWQDDGGGSPQYPAADGSLIILPAISAEDVSYDNSSSLIDASNVQQAIDFLHNTTDPLSRINVPATYRYKAIPEQADPNLDFERITVANRVNVQGLLDETDIDVLRHQYDPLTGDYKGHLIESASTNLFVQSNNFGTSWANNGSRITLTQSENDPFGGTDGWLFERNASGAAYIYQSRAVTNATNYVQSYWVHESSEPVNIQFFSGSGFNAGSIIFDPATRVFSGLGGTLGGYGIAEETANGFIRIYAWQPAIATASNNVGFGLGATSDEAIICCAQFETGSSPTSYIETAASAVTRAADQVDTTIPSINEGTLYFEGLDFSVPASAVNGYILSLSDGSGDNEIAVRRNISGVVQLFMRVGGVAYGATPISLPVGVTFRAAFSFKGGQLFGAINGVPVTFATMPPTINPMSILRIGSYGNGANVNNGMIHKDGAIFERALSQDQINRITAI